jgi:ferredoxin
MTLTDYGESVMPLAVWASKRRLWAPTSPGWRRRVVPVLGHFAVRMINNGRRSCHAIPEPLSRRGRIRRLHGRSDRRGVRLPSSPTSTSTHGYGRFGQTTPSPWRPRGRRNQGQTSPFGPLIVEIRDVVRRGVDNVGGNRIPFARRAAWRPNCNRHIARCYALGRGRQRPWVRAFVPDLHGRRRNFGTRPSQDRRLQFDQYGTAVPDTWICVRSAPPSSSAAAAGHADPLHTERFTAKPLTEPARTDAFEVVLAQSELTLTIPPERTILDMVEEAGVGILSSCAEGTCGTCETSVLEGEPDHRDSVLDEDERRANDCMMICVSRSCSPRLVLDL